MPDQRVRTSEVNDMKSVSRSGSPAAATGASDRPRTRPHRRRQLAGLAIVGALYWAAVRPRLLNWGATPAEVRRYLPGDALLPDADGVSTMAITIDAPPEAVWPWLRQLGQERGGFYSYTWAENLVGLGIRNADEIVPEYQNLAVGETVRLGRADRFPDAELEVASMNPPASLVLQTPDDPPWWVWAFVLDPVGEDRTRLLVRARVRLPENPLLRVLSEAVLDPVTVLMTVGMLRGIRSRAERTGTGPETSVAER
jgi:hypothetical protein